MTILHYCLTCGAESKLALCDDCDAVHETPKHSSWKDLKDRPRPKGFRGYGSFNYWLRAKVRDTRDFFRYDIPQGVGNLITWFPIIWRDRDWDWYFLAVMLEKKLRRMSALETKYGHHLSSSRDARQQLICATLLKRLQDAKYFDESAKVYGHVCRGSVLLAQANQHHEQELLGKLLGKHLTHWWD